MESELAVNLHNLTIERTKTDLNSEKYAERYERMIDVENLAYNTNYQEFFNNIPDKILVNIVEYLNWIKIEFLKLIVRRSGEVEDLIYRNGLFTATTKFLEVFAKALAAKSQGKFETDQISGESLQDKHVQEIKKIQEGKNI